MQHTLKECDRTSEGQTSDETTTTNLERWNRLDGSIGIIGFYQKTKVLASL